jgi:hypothetical protein
MEEALDAFAAHRPALRDIKGVSPALREAIVAALDALDADPAAWPPLRVQFPVLSWGEKPEDGDEPVWHRGSWTAVESLASRGAPPVLLIAELRALRRGELGSPPAPRAVPTPDRRAARMLLLLARRTLPAWKLVFPRDARPLRVIEDAENVLAGGKARRTKTRRALHREAYPEEEPPPEVQSAYIAARVAVWAHSEAVGDGENDEQDTPPDLAVAAAVAIPAFGRTEIERERAFWEDFFLEVVPRASRAD